MDEVITSSPLRSKSSSFRKQRKKKFHQSESFTIENGKPLGMNISSNIEEDSEDLFEEEYDLLLAELVPPTKPRNIDTSLLSQHFVNLKDFIEKKEENKLQAEDLDKKFIQQPSTSSNLSRITESERKIAVIDRIFKDFEISPVKEKANVPTQKTNNILKSNELLPVKERAPYKIIRTYPGCRRNIKSYESDCESSISWQEDVIHERNPSKSEDLSKSQVMINQLLNLSNFFSESEYNSVDPNCLDCTQKACAEDISLPLSFIFMEEDDYFEPIEKDECEPSKFNDFYDYVFDGSMRVRLFEVDDLDETHEYEVTNLENKDSDVKIVPEESEKNLSILCGNTELFAGLCEPIIGTKNRKHDEDINLQKNLSIFCGNTEFFEGIRSEDLINPLDAQFSFPNNAVPESIKKPSAKRKLSLDLEGSPKEKKKVRFDFKTFKNLNNSKCNIEVEPLFEGFDRISRIDSKTVSTSIKGAFQTAGKKSIQISDEALRKSSRMYDEVMNEDKKFEVHVQPSFSEILPISFKKSTRSFKESLNGGENLKKDIHLENLEMPKVIHQKPSFSGMFKTAGKKSIQVSEDALKRYTKMYEDDSIEINIDELDKEKKRFFDKENVKETLKEQTPKPKLPNKFSRAKSSPNLKAFCDNAAQTSTPIIKQKGKKLTQEEVTESIAAFLEDSNSFDETPNSKNISVSDRISLLSNFDNPPPLSPITPVSGKTTKKLGLRRFASFQISKR
ncbi:BRCA2 family protein [Megaselia abdita]